ncbi:flagellar biosynthetic protein FliR [Hydrogenoanaerobacterium saccharovorans]|uniref:Flagellar biosynthetic protein FliR n=1 Tax=Hydrogenoanaerobacterium saccharovorans TaxID=474960 RepID=A0A1H7ZV80_9FIRM|nr:flagellar biosynthetic protein FliR [Hydrogenoanaerobacterium saccharovorans]RPF48404.1 flagellar biosynthetic protein FliR [Hydrogenoanaerobacterium saccharovorans]SEM61488.1 flagellar biosynthetic protein FliR [Hydrogenoanaerobacterium saccharovorans]
MWNELFAYLDVFMLVFVRMSGMILFNPLFNRRSVPAQIRMGLILALTILITPTVDGAPIAAMRELEMILAMFKELFLGFVCGFVFQIFYYMLFFAGDFMDMQFGLSMSKVFDPSSNIQMSVSGNLMNLLFMFYIFATDSHLILIKIFATSYQIVPVGAEGLTTAVGEQIINLFIAIFVLGLKLALPFVVAEFTLEVAMGILMRIIPQIHIFVINIQAKLFVGIILLFLFAHPVGSFMDKYVLLMLENMQRILFASVA